MKLISWNVNGLRACLTKGFADRFGELDADRPVLLHCAGGYRSSVGASWLKRHGFDDVSDVIGGYNAIAAVHA